MTPEDTVVNETPWGAPVESVSSNPPPMLDAAVDEGVEEVDFSAAKEEQAAPTAQTQAEEESVNDTLDALVPRTASRRWSLGPNGDYEFVQSPMSFLAKMQWFALVGEVIDEAISGDRGLSINNLFSAPESARGGGASLEDFRDADTFVAAIGKLLSVAPDFLVKSITIWLQVPDYQRGIIAEILALPVEQGGLSDDDGMEIIETFIDQNYEALDSFFREKIGALRRRVEARQKAMADKKSASSKR